MIIGKSKTFDLKMCNSFFNRLVGNCFKTSINKVLCFPKCNSIHTFFMFLKIDVVMLNKNKIVKFVFSGIKPWKIILPKKGIYYTLEFPNGENIYKINDKIELKKEI